MSRARALRFGLITGLMVALLAISAPMAAAAGSNTRGGGSNTSAGGASIPGDLAAAAQGLVGPESTFLGPHAMTIGSSFSGISDLEGLLPSARDIILAGNVGGSTGTLTATITDCCIVGDTMLLILLVRHPGTGITSHVDVCTSPDSCSVDATFEAGAVALGIFGFVDSPGGFPAGYDWSIELN